jgi:hypothetical protein
MRRRQLKKLWARFKELQQMAPARDTLLLKLGAAKSQYPSGWRLVKIEVSQHEELSFYLRARFVSGKAAICFAPI